MCVERSGIGCRRSFEMLVCMMAHTRSRLVFCVDVSAHTFNLFVLQKASCYLGPFHLIVHTHVCCRSQDWRSQVPFAVLAHASVCEYAWSQLLARSIVLA